jgi:hypothetical protein
MITAFVVKKKYPATAFSWELVLVKSENKIDTHFFWHDGGAISKDSRDSKNIKGGPAAQT